ncbi:MAG: PAS domain-containing protein [Alphaproteobacteria bacterium]|jgi:hypothetical protein|nr:PAS domain-containing protein [Alphaproteobacteria bacterium]
MPQSASKAVEDPAFILDPSLTASHPIIDQAIRFWRDKRGARLAPARGDIGLQESKAFLAHLQIFELIDGGPAYRVRLMGTAIVKALGEDSTGKTFDRRSPLPVVRRVLSAIEWVLQHREPLRTFTPRTAAEGRDFFAHETVFLPLSSDGRSIDMIAIVGVFLPSTT